MFCIVLELFVKVFGSNVESVHIHYLDVFWVNGVVLILQNFAVPHHVHEL